MAPTPADFSSYGRTRNVLDSSSLSTSGLENCPQHAFGFGPGLGLFLFRVTARRDAAANRKLPIAAGRRDRSNQDVEVRIAPTA